MSDNFDSRKRKIEQDEVVIVKNEKHIKKSLRGRKGVVMGISEEDSGKRGCAVTMLHNEFCYFLWESDLNGTGEFMPEDYFYLNETPTLIDQK